MRRKVALFLATCGLLAVPALGASAAVASPGGGTGASTAPAGWERVDSGDLAGLVAGSDRTASPVGPSEEGPVAVQSVRNAQYLTAEKLYAAPDTGLLRTRSASVAGWEQFDLSWDETGEFVSLKSHANGLYVAAELNYTGAANGVLRARSADIAGWERFCLLYNEDLDQYALQSAANGLFVAMENNYTGSSQYVLRARSATIAGWERFCLFPESDASPMAGR